MSGAASTWLPHGLCWKRLSAVGVRMRGIGVLGPLRVVGANGAPLTVREPAASGCSSLCWSRRRGSTGHWPMSSWRRCGPTMTYRRTRLRRSVPGVPAAPVLVAAGGELETQGSGYRFDCDRDLLDVARFEYLVTTATARQAEPAVALGWLDEGLGLWRGWPTSRSRTTTPCEPNATRLEEMRAQAAGVHAELLLDLGRTNDAARAAEALMAEHPFRERPVSIRMRTLANEGRHAEALQVFQEFRRLLGEELGLDPSPQLRALEGDILRHDLPAPPTVGLPGNSLVGREVDLAEISACLDTCRLVTRPAPAASARAVSPCTPPPARRRGTRTDGLCELATIDSSDAVVPTVATALHVQPRAEETYADRGRPIPPVARWVPLGARQLRARPRRSPRRRRLLARCPRVDVLATSRAPSVSRASTSPRWTLPVPDGEAPGRQRSRCSSTGPGRPRRLRAHGGDDAAAVVRACRRLDGLPLAIELAAARTVSRTPHEILDEVTDRFDRLADPYRARERHRSMVAVGLVP